MFYLAYTKFNGCFFSMATKYSAYAVKKSFTLSLYQQKFSYSVLCHKLKEAVPLSATQLTEEEKENSVNGVRRLAQLFIFCLYCAALGDGGGAGGVSP